MKEAITVYKKSLDLDPLMWCSYSKLCKLNPNAVDITKTFSELNSRLSNFIKKVSNAMNSSCNEDKSERKNKDFSLSPEENFKPNLIMNSGDSLKNQSQTKQSNLFTIDEVVVQDSVKKKQPLDVKNSTLFVPQNNSGNNNLGQINANINNVYNLFVNTAGNSATSNYSNQKANFNTPQAQLTKEYRVDFNQKNPENRPKFLINSSLSLSPGALNFASGGGGASSDSNILGVAQNEKPNPFILSISNSNNNSVSNSICTPKEKQEKHNMVLQEFVNYQNKDSSFDGINKVKTNNEVNMFSAFDKNVKFGNIARLIKAFAEITKLINIFSNKEAIEALNQLPYNYKKSGWVLSNLGRCFFELGRYRESEKIYQECLKREPYRLEGLDYYSTTLWHLKDQYQLCTLANHCLEQSHFQQETWIVVGNCYSLQRESEAALSFFKRSIQLNPYYSYAYTLCGHEFVEIENFQQAKVYYLQAIANDER